MALPARWTNNDLARSLDRRRFLAVSGTFAAATTLAAAARSADDATDRALKVAAIFTEFTYRSHAHVILENFLEPYLFNGRPTQPGCEIVSFYGDQFPKNEMGRDVARRYGIPIFPTIAEALTLGGDKLAVDAVLSIGEHGNYPVNEKGQMEYPRKRFFDEIVAVFERSGRVVPLFNDKHLSYRWDWAKEMVDTARRLEIPFMAGSSVPLAERRPPLELPPRAKVVEAVCVHGGMPESYGFHALEVLLSFVEFRLGGESGIASVRYFEGDALWQAAADGLWSVELAQTALAQELGTGQPPLRELAERLGAAEQKPAARQPPHGLLIAYRDGLRGFVLGVGSKATRWNFACSLAGETAPRATRLYTGPWNNRNLFKALAHAIQTHFRQRRAPYPVERTLLVTGALDALMDSRQQGGMPIATPHLEFGYAARDFTALRETGASWKIITEATPEPSGIGQGS
ncbi:MAG TPA: hypothetical protein VND64_02735 [Pirellulales bacterium]|nr:hypothetical protein [Pirellulales bacterium]